MKIVHTTLSKNHNVSNESDSSLFLRYIGFFLFIILMIYVFFIVLSYIVVFFVSIEDEKKFFSVGNALGEKILPLPEYLSERYSDVEYDISIIDMDTENAFADLGGAIYLTQDFLENVESYESLDFIIGHEVQHLKNRDVLRGLVSDIPVALILSIFGGETGHTLFQNVIANNYNKYQERRADIGAVDFLVARSGHAGCALGFFENHNSLIDNISEIFSTHPMTQGRIQTIEKYIQKKGYLKESCTPFIYNP